MSVLLALFGPKRGVRLEITEQATLGRSSEVDLQLVDGKVSRQHCRFSVRRGQLEVEDLGSNNGTYVNGQRLTAAQRLAPGDEIAVGDSLFLVDGDDDAAAARFGDTTLIVSRGASTAPEATLAAETAAPGAAPLLAAAALAGVLRGCADQEAAARAVLAAMETALEPTRAFVLLWDAESGLARPLVGRADDRVVAVSRTLLERAAAHRRGIAVQDAVADRVLRQARSVVRHQIRAVVVAPILMADAVVGFLYADRARPGYQADDAALLHCFAATFALGGHLPSNAATTTAQARPAAADQPVGNSQAWREVLRVAAAAATASSTVLISGPSGTGKEEIARFIHRRSARAAGPFVAVNCGAIPEALAESELFGHEKGAFTGALATRIGYLEAADGGTLFLDELGELPAALQVKLLRVLQERVLSRVGSTIPLRVNLRVVAATHRDLDAEVRAGRFREDLFYRLAVIRLQLPALKDRPEDIVPLARTLLARVAAQLGRRDPGLDASAERALVAGRWPGNARQLGNVLERGLVLRPPGNAQPLSADDLRVATSPEGKQSDGDQSDDAPNADPSPAGGALGDKVAALERAEIEAALRRARGVKSRAATALGLSRPTLDKKLAELGINLWKQAD